MSIVRTRLLVTAALAALVLAPHAQAAHAATSGPDVPDEIAVPDGNKVFLTGHAVGVQIYTCDPATGWVLLAPRASLYDDKGKLVATHYAGPTWQARDGSTVVGEVEQRYPVAGTVPWLRLRAASKMPGSDGDRMVATSFVQQGTSTTGGVAPSASSCDSAMAGSTAEVPCTADYYFWKPTGS